MKDLSRYILYRDEGSPDTSGSGSRICRLEEDLSRYILCRDEGRPGASGSGSRISRLEEDEDLSGIDEEQLR